MAPVNRRTIDRSIIHSFKASPKIGMFGYCGSSAQLSLDFLFCYKKLKQTADNMVYNEFCKKIFLSLYKLDSKFLIELR